MWLVRAIVSDFPGAAGQNQVKMATNALEKPFEVFQTPNDTFAHTLLNILLELRQERDGIDRFLKSLPEIRPTIKSTLEAWKKEDQVLVKHSQEPANHDQLETSLQGSSSDEPWRYDEINTPARIPGYATIAPAMWKEIPLRIRDLIKQLEETRKDGRLNSLLALFSSLALASALAGAFIFIPHLLRYPIWMLTPTMLIACVILFISLFRLYTYSTIVWRGKMVGETIRLRPLDLAEFAWEKLPVMNLLRRQGCVIFFEGRQFNAEELTRNRALCYVASLIAITSISLAGLNLALPFAVMPRFFYKLGWG